MSILSPLIFFLLAIITTNPAHSSPKISPSVIQAFQERRSVSAIIQMRERPSFVLAGFTSDVSFPSRADRITAVVTALKEHAARSQAKVLALLGKMNQNSQIHFESLWISNKIAVYNLQPFSLENLHQFEEVDEISEEKVARIHDFVIESGVTKQSLKSWGIDKIQAPNVWNSGNTGKHVVIGSIDTGVRSTHEALRNSFRQSYGWFDPSQKSKVPNDPDGHGTHVMGILAGASAIYTGVAPGSTWIACRGCRSTGCFESDLLACGQFMLCPTDTKGDNPDCSMAPNVISNSWGTETGGNNFYDDVIEAWMAAGIIPVFSVGNSGPNCTTASSPGDSNNVIAVGATDSQDHVADFSSAGPSLSMMLKPDFSAPGVLITSAWNISDTSYAISSGTSMAAPHLAGTVALLLSENQDLEYNQIYLLLKAGVMGNNATGQSCSGVSDSAHPNFQAGYGRINAFASVQAAKIFISGQKPSLLSYVQWLMSMGFAIPLNSLNT